MSDAYDTPRTIGSPKRSGMAVASAALGILPWICCCGMSLVGGMLGGFWGARGNLQEIQARLAPYQVASSALSCIFLLMALIGIVCGFMALSQIKRTPQSLTGKGFAWTGIVSGALYLLLVIIIIVIFLAVLGLGAASLFGSH